MRSAIMTSGMVTAIMAGLLVSGAWVRGQQRPSVAAVRCLHDRDETPENRERREQALTLARAINASQGRAVEQTKRYQPLAQLPALPSAPAGFVVQLHTDGEAYMFSIKDDRDPCRYGIFSDQQAFLYESSPTLPLVAS